ncbi:MAG: 3-hydroxyacyl-CoA dehydrogenase [Marinicaulis sp.]|nr:3-hydroxyacyl-CoA dehydrogenase [Marinicaulis sp.]
MPELMTYEREYGVAIITIDSPPVNALGHAVRSAVVEAFEKAAQDKDVDAIVLTCGGRTFFAGADITEFGKPMKSPHLGEMLDVIEASPKLTVAAIHGTALGGGCETALCCNYRIAIPSAKIGLPEVNLGLLPGAGGTQRLPRLVGVPIALDMITSGKPINANTALDYGVFDKLADEVALRADAVAYARALVDKEAPKVRVRDREDKIAEYEGNIEVFNNFRKENARKFRGFKAPENIIKCIEAAVELPFDESIARERELFMELMGSIESAAQRYVFFAERQTAKVPDVPNDTPTRDIKRVGVIGAGTMGGGITMNFLSAGVPVTLVEQTEEALDRGVGVIRKNYESSVRKGRMSMDAVETAMGFINPTTELEALGDADLIIEAVFEQMDIKKEIIGKLGKIAKDGAILASNTSYLDIDEIAASTNRPQDVMGLHFFSPANIMPLLEIVRGENTSKDLINTAMVLSKKIRKTPVLSRVGHGFIANRVMTVRGKQANMMALQGVSPADIDRVIFDYGFAMGPFQMFDLVGLDVIGRDANEKTVASELVARDRLGQKKNGGYYDYDENRKATLSPLAMDIIKEVAAEKGVDQISADDDEILARLLYPVVNEGAKVLDENIAIRGSDIDIACIKGYNWPVYRGGPMFWADTVGLDKIVATLSDFEKRFGEAFTPSPFLEKCAASGERLSQVVNE